MKLPIESTVTDILWRMTISLECTVAWLEAGRDPKEAAAELKLNIKTLDALRARGAKDV